MRLSDRYQEVIKTACKSVFGEGAEVFLFGSRVDDSKLVGILIYI
jgi:hypothetical protein